MASGFRDVIALVDGPLRDQLHRSLQDTGWKVHWAADAEMARSHFEQQDFHVGLLQLSGLHYGKFLDQMGNRPSLQWIALMDYSQSQLGPVYRNLLAGLYDYHTLPVNLDRLTVSLGHAWGKGKLLKPPLQQPGILEQYGIVGRSSAIQELFQRLGKASQVDSPVLIVGESGTGKELAAKAIHLMSSRRKGPFVAVNCAALPSNLIQSELFGHEKGAFTGAYHRKIGRMEAANGGTIFLDEIGDLPLELQANLLRVLQDKVIERVGSCEWIQLDIRIIAASHVNLEEAVAENRFRGDLYYRLNVIGLTTPPLRERQGDVELLAQAYLEKYSLESGSRVKGFSRQALRAMNQFHWPGNIRELANRIRQASIMAEHRFLTPRDLGLERRVAPQGHLTLDSIRATAERDAIRSALRRTQQNVSEAAIELGISRPTLYRLMKRYDLSAGATSAKE